MTASLKLHNRRVLLTGASSGIGRALAVALAEEGARLVLAARRQALLESLASEIGQAGHPPPTVVVADLSRRGGAQQLANEADASLGGIDILINNAGTSPIGGQEELGDDDSVRAAFETNFWSPLALTRALLPGMREQGDGMIVNVTSTVQSVPIPLVGYYSASKAALAQATRALRHELQDSGIRVLEIVPGSTDTALRDIDLLPWHGHKAPRTMPPEPPATVARKIIGAIIRRQSRLVYPSYSLLPLELPAIGRLVARLAAKRIDTRNAAK